MACIRWRQVVSTFGSSFGASAATGWVCPCSSSGDGSIRTEPCGNCQQQQQGAEATAAADVRMNSISHHVAAQRQAAPVSWKDFGMSTFPHSTLIPYGSRQGPVILLQPPWASKCAPLPPT